MTNYVEITKTQMENLLVGEMQFARAQDDMISEFVYERPVITTSGTRYPYTIRVYTSIHKQTCRSRPSGSDAIRVVLIDTRTGKPAKKKERRVHRTKNALPNLKERCRDVFRYVLEHRTPETIS